MGEGQDTTSDYDEDEMDGTDGEWSASISSVMLQESPSAQLEMRLSPTNATPLKRPTLAKKAPRGNFDSLGRWVIGSLAIDDNWAHGYERYCGEA